MFENAGLLLGGLGTGAVAALLALLPHFWLGGRRFPCGIYPSCSARCSRWVA